VVPENVHRLQRSAHQVAGMKHEVFGVVLVCHALA
jgi:hypothetical protein